MTRADLTIRRNVLGETYLRVDEIRHTTLMALALAWADDRSAVIDVLDELASVAASARRPEGELDAAMDDVESVCGMDEASVPVRRDDLMGLINEATMAYQGPRPAASVAGPVRGAGVAA